MSARWRAVAASDTALVQRLIEEAQTRGKHVMIGGDRRGERRLDRAARKLGSPKLGVLREVARKFSTWLDLLFMQRML